jgi:hypothetical protein
MSYPKPRPAIDMQSWMLTSALALASALAVALAVLADWGPATARGVPSMRIRPSAGKSEGR